MEDFCDDDNMMSTCELNRLEPISNRITNIFFLLHLCIRTIYLCVCCYTLSLPGTIVYIQMIHH